MVDRMKNMAIAADAWLIRHRWTRVLRRATLGFFEHEALHNAASMAYFAILALFQLVVLGVVVLSYFLGEGAARDFIVEQVGKTTPIDDATIEAIIDGVISARGGITVVSIVLLAWGALGLFSALNRGIAGAFVTAKRRNFVLDKLVGLSLIALAGALVLLSMAIGFITNVLRREAGDLIGSVPGGEAALTLFGFLVPVFLIFVAFLAVYRITPNRPVSLGEIWPGALVAALAWTVLRIGFTFFATEIANYDTVFGPISTAISLLVFLYFSSVVILLGAELARANVLDDEVPIPEPLLIELERESAAAAAPQLAPQEIDPRPLSGWSMAIGGIVARRVIRRIRRRGNQLS
jgi:membrane protein